MANLFEVARRKILNGIRVKPVSKTSGIEIDVDDNLSEQLIDDTVAKLINNISEFRELSGNRAQKYDAFDEMEKDSVIAAALKMYADDATQYNLNGDVLWVESDDPNIALFGNRLIKVLRLNEHAWQHIYNLVKYGDIYLETFFNGEDSFLDMDKISVPSSYGTVVNKHKPGSRIEEYVEMVPDPASVFELRKRGKTAGFLFLPELDTNKTNVGQAYSIQIAGTDQRILPSDKYVHISLGQASNRYPETFDISFSDDTKEGGFRVERYVVATGKSILEDVFRTYRELHLMEDSILLNRVTRSAITRILQVEVGDMPKNQVKEKLRQIKMMIEQKNFMDTDAGIFSNQASPGPVDNIVYVPTRNGNGAITASTIGGDVDPKTLIDIEYYQQKEAGGLNIPLSYLKAQSGDGGGLSSGTALTKLDNRYARTIKRIQTAYCAGIQTLFNIFAIKKGLLDYVNNFKVRMLSPSTIEDSDRDEQLNNRIGMVNDLLAIIQSSECFSEATIKEIVTYLTTTFLNKPEIGSFLEKDESADNSEENQETESEGLEVSGGADFDTSFDMGGGEDSWESSDTSIDTDALADAAIDISSSDTASDEGFGDYEEFA